MNYPPVVVVDEHDNEIGSAMLAEVWRKGLYHRIASVYVVDDDDKMLLQLRGPNVKVDPSRWDQAAGGHVDEGATYEQTAYKELFEETGIENVELELLGTFRNQEKLDDGRNNNQFERAFLARVSANIKLALDPDEVKRLEWFTVAELSGQLALNPEKFTMGLKIGLQKYFPNII